DRSSPSCARGDFRNADDIAREIPVGGARSRLALEQDAHTDFAHHSACARTAGPKIRSVDDMGTNSAGIFWGRATDRDSIQLGFYIAGRRGHGRRTPSEQSSTDDVDPRQRRY